MRAAGAGAPASAAEPAPAPVAITALTLVHGWPEDAARWLRSLAPELEAADAEAVLVDNSGDPEVAAALNLLSRDEPGRVRVIGLQPTGWAEAANAGVAAAAGSVVILFDPGVEAGGPVLQALAAALDEPGVVVAGGFGVRGAGTVKEFQASEGPEVDAVEGYAMAFRRSVFQAAGGFDRRFRFYRIADFELSFRLRAQAGGRAVVVPGLDLVRHQHRLWEATEPVERERLSRRNFYRFLDRWRDRDDLLVGGSAAEQRHRQHGEADGREGGTGDPGEDAPNPV